jgi:nucleolar protein 58
MLVLFETAAGYAIFKITDEKKLKSAEDIAGLFQSPEKAQKL